MNAFKKLVALLRGDRTDSRAAADRQAVIDLHALAAVAKALRE